MTADEQNDRRTDPASSGVHPLVDDAARAGERLVRAWSRLEDDERFELVAALTRRLQDIRRRSAP